MKTSQFHFDKETKKLISEASTLQFRPAEIIVIESSTTGERRTFQHQRTERDQDGDILFWEYIPTGAGGKVSKVVIFND